MLARYENVLCDSLQAIDDLTDPTTGFLPPRSPLVTLPPPYGELSEACEALPERYHGPQLDCRPWLQERFGQIRPEWLAALKDADRHLRENLMTRVSLLCHAYRWQRMPTPPECYRLESIVLPAGLEALWTRLAELLGIPRVGIFYTMVSNNWRLAGLEPGSPYQVDALHDGGLDLVHSWLLPPIHEELRTFVTTALLMESRGVKVLTRVKNVHECILGDNAQEATYHLTVLAAVILGLNASFNRAIKKSRIRPDHFLRYVQPTMIWLLDHGDGPLEGASGPQACTLQLLDSFLGIPRDTKLGSMILRARAFMLPAHRHLLERMDRAGEALRAYVLEAQAPRLLEAYNRCLSLMQAWRTSHQKRGALYIEGDSEQPVEHYVSTGLVVQDDAKRSQVFSRSMEEHIESTRRQVLENPWAGRERSLEYLFRFLTPQQRELLRRHTEVARFKAGESIISEGDLFPGLFALTSGTATVLKNENAVDSIAPHEVFGEMSLIENLPASASIVADVELEVEQVSLETVYDLIGDNREAEGEFYLALAQLLSHRLRNRSKLGPTAPAG